MQRNSALCFSLVSRNPARDCYLNFHSAQESIKWFLSGNAHCSVQVRLPTLHMYHQERNTTKALRNNAGLFSTTP